MSKKCCLCQKSAGFFTLPMSEIYNIGRIKSYANIFPSANVFLSQYHLTGKEVFLCDNCTDKVSNLFANKWAGTRQIDNNYTDACTEIEMEKARQYVLARLPKVNSDNAKRFFEYALSIPEKVLARRKAFPQIVNDCIRNVSDSIEQRNKKIRSMLDGIKKGIACFNVNDYSYVLTDTELIRYPINITSGNVCLTTSVESYPIYKLIKAATPSVDIESECTSFVLSMSRFENEKRYLLNSIEYYNEVGNLQYTSEVQGGGGGGANVYGAIKGGLLFGAAGAIVGSQVGTESKPISTTVRKHDNRSVRFVYKDSMGVHDVVLPHEDLDALLTLIPDKKYDTVMLKNQEDIQANQTVGKPLVESKEEVKSTINSDVVEQLKQLKELLDIGILTQEEFNRKKNELLKL